MKPDLSTKLLEQLDELLEEYKALLQSLRSRSASSERLMRFRTAAASAISRIAGPNSDYDIQAKDVMKQYPPSHIGSDTELLGGILKALRHDIAAGYLDTLKELIHAGVFADFLEMAKYLLDQGYKDASAVLIGGVLEEHLRKLCEKNDIEIDFMNSQGKLRPKKVEAMNADLAREKIYSKTEQKSVMFWYALRTHAAHAEYTEYDESQIEQMYQGVLAFITRHRA